MGGLWLCVSFEHYCLHLYPVWSGVVELRLEADIWAALSSGKEGRKVEAMAGRRGGAAMVVVCCYWGAFLIGYAVADGNFLSLAPR